MHRWLIATVFCVGPLVAATEDSLSRIKAHLTIGDPVSAAKEALRNLAELPPTFSNYEAAIQSLSAVGDEEEVMRVWDEMRRHFPEESLKKEILEEICWGILQKGKKAVGLASQLIDIIAAALTQDVKAIHFLKEGMSHSNAHIRTISVELASLYGDEPLKMELARLFKEEKNSEVRLTAIKAIGSLKMEEFRPAFLALLSDPKCGASEKKAIIIALVNMQESLGKEELEKLALSPRAGLRLLACEAILHNEQREHFNYLKKLCRDSHPDVQVAALRAIGILRLGREMLKEEIKLYALESLDPLVGLTASWIWLLEEPEEGGRALNVFLTHEDETIRAMAASAVASSGSYGIELAKEGIATTSDPFVKANLALALLGQRVECVQACQILDDFLRNHSEKWMWVEEGHFKSLQKSQLKHDPAIANFPEVMDQKVRLEILNLMAILEYPGALDALKLFLKKGMWKLTGLAAEVLLEEGDQAAIDLVKELLRDPDDQIRVEAALVLASWAKDGSSLPTLLAVYPKANREMQVKILESLGRIKNKGAISFLLNRLRDPSQMIRLVAASVLLQTLNG